MNIELIVQKIKEAQELPYFVFISGGSGAGKTFLARKLMLQFENEATLIEMDDYFKDTDDATLPMFGGRVSFDLPSSYHLDEIREGLRELKNSKPITVPVYSICKNQRIGQIRVEQKKIVIVDGLYASMVSDVIENPDQKVNIFVWATTQIRLQRRVKRDMARFDCSLESIGSYFFKYIEPIDQMYVSKQKADITTKSDYRKDE